MPWSPTAYPFLGQYLDASAQVVARACHLESVTINQPDPAAGCTITLHDVADAGDIAPANIIARIAMDSALFVIPTTLMYDAELSNGLYVLFSAGFSVGNVTVSYR